MCLVLYTDTCVKGKRKKRKRKNNRQETWISVCFHSFSETFAQIFAFGGEVARVLMPAQGGKGYSWLIYVVDILSQTAQL